MTLQTFPTVSTRLSAADRLGRFRVRWAIGRKRYRVEPGLYRVGAPDSESPVLVTANYKLTFDVLRAELGGIDAWLLVLDTRGVNVWCAAGKGTFGTEELVRRVEATRLPEVVSHRKLIVPQLGGPGIAAHEVRRLSGFRVVYGPVRARDIKEFLASRMRATDEMRSVSFDLKERAELVGVEVVGALKWLLPILLLLLLLRGGDWTGKGLAAGAVELAPILMGLVAGTVLVPLLLPWIPWRSFSVKGAIVGVLVVGATLLLTADSRSALESVQLLLLGTGLASFFAMQFTGATTFTSPSGVEWEMRRALPFQVGSVLAALGLGLLRWSLG